MRQNKMVAALIPLRLPGLDDLRVEKRAVLVRVDYNIAALPDGAPVDDFRLKASMPTIQELIKRKARIVLLTHRGRPQGQAVPELSTRPLAPILAKLVGHGIRWAPDCVGRAAEQAIADLPPGEVLLLENTRFHLGEQLNQQSFVQQMARLGEVFVNEAFPALHRAHASLSGLAAAMPEAAIGRRVAEELGWLAQLLGDVKRPLLVMVGGAHIGPKMEWLQRLIGHVDQLMVGGAVAHTLLAARDVPLGLSHYEPAFVEAARDFITEAGVVGSRLLMPLDLVVARRDTPETPSAARLPGRLQASEVAHDIGPETVKTWSQVVRQAGSILWLGSMGTWEQPAYRDGTLALAREVAASQALSVVGGDGLLQAIKAGELTEKMPRLSAGAAVWMAALSGQPLPSLQIMAAKDSGGWNGQERRGGSRA
jgi:phosphoglycerate kinase